MSDNEGSQLCKALKESWRTAWDEFMNEGPPPLIYRGPIDRVQVPAAAPVEIPIVAPVEVPAAAPVGANAEIQSQARNHPDGEERHDGIQVVAPAEIEADVPQHLERSGDAEHDNELLAPLPSDEKLMKFGDMLRETVPRLRNAANCARSISNKLKATSNAFKEAVKPLEMSQPQIKVPHVIEPKTELELELANARKKKDPPPPKMRRLSQNQKKELKVTMEVAIDTYLENQTKLRALSYETVVTRDLSEVELMLLDNYHGDKEGFEKWNNSAKWLAERKKFHEGREVMISRYYSVFFGLVASKYLENPIFVFDTFILDKLSKEPEGNYWETSYVKHVLGNDVVYKFKELYKQQSI